MLESAAMKVIDTFWNPELEAVKDTLPSSPGSDAAAALSRHPVIFTKMLAMVGVGEEVSAT